MTYLHRRKGSPNYYFRRGVPEEIREAVARLIGADDPIWEIKESLGTPDVIEAKRRAHRKALEVEALFKRALAECGIEERDQLSPLEISKLVDVWKHDVLSEDEEYRREGISEREFEKYQEAIDIVEIGGRFDLARGNVMLVEFEVEDLLDRNGINLRKNCDAYRQLAYELMKATVEVNSLLAKRHAGEVVSTPPSPFISRAAAPTQPGTGQTLFDLHDGWKREAKPRKQTADEFYTAARRFTELHGSMAATKITRQMLVEFKDALLQLPKRMSRELRGKMLPEQIEQARRNPDWPRLKAAAVRKQLNGLRAILSWAVDNARLDQNPMKDVTVRDDNSAEIPRLSYDLNDLQKILAFPIFTASERPDGGRGEAAVWLPLLAMFTGARLTELGQLLTEDVREENCIPFIHIRAGNRGGEEQRVKRRSSNRRVPLHPELVRLGFVAYVNKRRSSGDIRVFPLLKPRPTTGVLTASWSTWWGRYARANGITDSDKTFHSLRHSFKDACRRAGIEEAVHDALTGHTNANVGRRYGNAGYPIELLAAEVSKIRYPGVAFKPLDAPTSME